MNFLGMKQMLLKGKDFLMKKLDELEIGRQEIDYAAEQIPKRLHSQLRVLERTEIDLEPTEEFAPYFKTAPTHTVEPLLYDIIKKDKAEYSYQLSKAIKDHQKDVPEFSNQQEQKAFRLKHAVDLYQEEIPPLSQSLICICMVNFHHKRGTEVEFRYPEKSLAESLENRIVYYAMPDSSHNKHEDYNFFNIQSEVEIDGRKRMLFGVSYFKQIKLTQEMKKDQEELTRSHLQKAVCVISTLPVFGYLRMRLAQTTKLFFEDFTNYEPIKCAFDDISKNLNETWQNMDMSELYIGSDLRNIVSVFGHKLMEVYKAILFSKRIVVFSHSPSSSSSFILSLLTLFPGMVTFGMSSKPINKYYESLREYGLPLRLFSRKNPLILSFHIQEFHLLDGFQDPKGRHFLIGTTNRLVKESKKLSTQLLLNLEDCSMQQFDMDEGGWEGLTSEDKHFINHIIEVTSSSNNEGYQGSEDWIREQFHSYLKQNLVKMVEAKNLYRKFLKDCQLYQDSLKNRTKDLPPKEDTPKLQIPYVDPRILKIPLSPMLRHQSFAYFLQFHNPNIYLLNDRYPVEEFLLLGVSEYYLGQLPRRDCIGITYNPNTRKLRYQSPDDSHDAKELRFNDKDTIVAVEVGKYLKNQLVNGLRLAEGELYTGDLLNGFYHGYGKLETSTETYIGHFSQGMYDGEGQLVIPATNNIYSGNFRAGIKHGKGRQQKEGLVVEGIFKDGKFSGEGKLTFPNQNVSIQGVFKGESVEEGVAYIFTFPNGDTFLGGLKNNQPEGEGIMTKVGFEPVKVKFEDGEAKEICNDSEEVRDNQ